MALVEIVVEIQKRHSGNNLICNGFQFFSKLPLTLYVRVRILHPLPKKKALKPLQYQGFQGLLFFSNI
jgi:hypothetical protein